MLISCLVQFSRSVMSSSLQPHGLQHARPPCPSLTPRVHPNPCPLSQWCHPAISSSVVPFSSCLQSSPASGSFQMSQLFASGGRSIGFSFSISPFNEYSGLISFRMAWLDFLAVQGTLKSLLQHHSSKASISCYVTANICNVYCVPRTSLDRILVNPYNCFIEPYTSWDSFCYFSHFTDGKIEGKGVK